MAVVDVVTGDITTLEVDAIVNAANEQLLAGGGVCGAIFAAAGHDALTESCRAIRQCPTGSAVITPAHRLAERSIRAIIHAVGPRWDIDDVADPRALLADEQLASAYRSALELAEREGCRSIAFPSISTGIYGFPARRAADIAASVVLGHRGEIERILLVGYDAAASAILREALEAHRACDNGPTGR